MLDLEILDLDLEQLFIEVGESDLADVAEDGCLKYQNILSDEILFENGIPLTCEEAIRLLCDFKGD